MTPKRNGWVLLAVAALLSGGGGAPAFADEASPPVQVTADAHKQNLEQAKTLQQEIRTLKEQLKADSRELRKLLQKMDEPVQDEVHGALKPFHDKLKEAYLRQKDDEELKKQLQAARMHKNMAEERDLTKEIVSAREQQLAALQRARQELSAQLGELRNR